MDDQNFTKNLVRFTPYLVIGFFSSLVLNYLIINSMAGLNTASVGLPVHAGKVVDGALSLNAFGFLADIIIWSFILAIVIAMLIELFGNKR